MNCLWLGVLIYWILLYLTCLFRCNHWRACVVHGNSSYYLDYYFSVPGWNTSWPNATVVRAVYNGTSVRGGASHDFYNIYDFFNFRPGSPNPSEFQLPSGYFCAGLKGLNKTVPKVPSAFSVNFEMVLRGTRRNRTFFVDSNWQVWTLMCINSSTLLLIENVYDQ